MSILSNKYNGTVITHDTANSTYVVVGNNSVSNIASTNTEVVDSATIRRVVWGTDGTGYWTVKRGANTILVLNGTNELLLNGMSINKDKSANVVVSLSGGTGFIMLELAKQGSNPTQY